MKTLTEHVLKDLSWTFVYSECLNYEVKPAVEEEFEGLIGEVEPATSWAYGETVYEATAPDGTALELGIDWVTGGDTRGTFNDLYDWAQPELNQNSPEPIQIRPLNVVASLTILDDDGEALDSQDCTEVLEELAQSLNWEQHTPDGLPEAPEPEGIDIDKDTDMETFTLKRDNEPDIRFTGEEVATADSYDPVGGPRNTRWTELTLYRTTGGKWVCHEVGITRWEGERTRYKAHICETDQELCEALGYGWLAKELYDEAGIDHAAEIE